MKKRFICLLFMIFCFSGALGEGSKLLENWQHVEWQVDCDGLLMTVDADVLEVPVDMIVREYHAGRVSDSFAKKTAEEMDWGALGFDLSEADWLKDEGYYTYNASNPNESVGIFASCEFFATRMATSYSPYSSIDVDTMYVLDQSPAGGLTWETVVHRADQITEMLGLQLGEPRSMKRCDDFIGQGSQNERFEYIWKKYFPELTAEDAAQIKTMEVFFPVYYNGLRLYSGSRFDAGENFILRTRFDLQINQNGEIIYLNCPIYEEWTPGDLFGEPIASDGAFELLTESYSGLILPGVESVRVDEAALEYVGISGDQTASKGFTVYPAWIFRVAWQYESEHELSEVTEYHAFHAITGQQLF